MVVVLCEVVESVLELADESGQSLNVGDGSAVFSDHRKNEQRSEMNECKQWMRERFECMKAMNERLDMNEWKIWMNERYEWWKQWMNE